MKKLHKFKCGSCQKEYEQFVDDTVKTFPCKCGSKATRLLSAPRFSGNSVGKNASWSK